MARLYRYRWQVELFFKWVKQHLRVKTFWGESENAVRIQIHVAIITYCLIGIIERRLNLNRPIVQIMRILCSALLL
uniref:transposase n=1 Tax=Prevotella herbatica TaxID=2801997 RepID=UPI0021D4032E|nr:transposase [Prevotella herbatica]